MESSCACTQGGGVPKTGQTTSYATGDDGDLQEGLAWPNPRFEPIGTYEVRDNLTGLVWHRLMTSFTEQTWQDALDNAAFGGYWRLPNLNELLSLVDYGTNYPAFAGSIGDFTTIPFDECYWTSTTHDLISTNAWAVCFGNGATTLASKTTVYSYTRIRK